MTRIRQKSVATWRQVKGNGYFESGVIYHNRQAICDEIYFKWVINGKRKWHYMMTVGEAMEMIRGLASALYYKLERDTAKKFGKLLSKNNPL